MLERGDVLLTWQLLREPKSPASLPIPVRRIGDHRKAYLTYEGPLSGNRGNVRRVDAGSVELEEITEDSYVLVLDGDRLSGRFALVATGNEWVFLKHEEHQDRRR
jgi:hypothetical protein